MADTVNVSAHLSHKPILHLKSQILTAQLNVTDHANQKGGYL